MEEKIYKYTECLNDEYRLNEYDNICDHYGMINCQKCINQIMNHIIVQNVKYVIMVII